MESLRVFALNCSREFSEAVAAHLSQPLARHEEREFEDGEHKSRPLETVRGSDVYVISSLNGTPGETVNDRLCRLLFFLSTLKDMGAARLTAICPYLGYSRKDRRTKLRDPVTTRYVAQLFEASGVDAVATMDVHNLAAFQNAFRKPTVHLEAAPLFVAHLRRRLRSLEPAVMSPDPGGVKRAESFRELLANTLNQDIPLVFMEKKRSEDQVSGKTVVGDVEGKTVLVIDDMISTGTTLSRSIAACHKLGCNSAIALATHGLFTDGAEALVQSPVLDRIVICNTIHPIRRPSDPSRLDVLDISPLIAETISKMHRGLPLPREVPSSAPLWESESF
ncbi:MAG TPA: ribose-phosphate pyrophosphokinase [Acidobacteriota bacterium]|nr:ribose-phosphate pyrophosphokinase [Acidobacteriota bacterium]